MNIFGKKKVKAPPDEVADAFLAEFIANNTLIPTIELKLTPKQAQKYASKCRLYRLALVLIIFINEEKENPKALCVRECIESKVFDHPDEQSHVLLKQVRSAMLDLQGLLFPEGNPRELSWARSWFETIGVDATNPVDLTLFSSSWMDHYVSATNALRDFKIV